MPKVTPVDVVAASKLPKLKGEVNRWAKTLYQAYHGKDAA